MTDAPSHSYRLAQALDRIVRRLNGRMIHVMPAVDRLKLGPLGGMVLLSIADLEPCSIQSLCSQLGRDNSQMTRVLRGLEDKGVIRRQSDPEDRRSSLISLTELGQDLVAEMRLAMSAVVDELASAISAGERADLADLLERLAEAGKA
ncbi:MAG: MarR family transcriptional regulator [Pseudomonadota bacterium]